MPLWGDEDTVADMPKYANSVANTLYGNTYGVSVDEAMNANTTVHGIHSGWVSGISYKDVHGNTRYKFQTLVAGSMITGENLQPTAGDGTVTVTTTSTTVTGSGTSFDTLFRTGDFLKVGDNVYKVASVANSTQLTLTANGLAAVAGVAYSRLRNDNAFFAGH